MQDITPEQIEQERLYEKMGLTEEEYVRVKRILGRRPNSVETGIFSVMWSEHCSYKSSKKLLKNLPTEGPHVLMGPGEGAGVVDIGENQAVVFKIESHNSPTVVDPYEGAATGVGGILRDVFSMGAKPIAILNSLRFGNLTDERTRGLLKEAVRGMADYGHHVGVPSVGGEIQFDDCYENTPLVNAMGIGLVNHEDIQKGIADGVGNLIIYAGNPTGRDGIHGAIHSSDDEISEDASPAKGNPHVEKRLIAACLEVIQSEHLVGMQDMGAAGLTSAGSEMASKAGKGMFLDLDLVPQAEEGLTAYEMMLSETQERMLLTVEKGYEEEFLQIFEKHDIEAAVIGEVTEERAFTIKHQGKVVANIPVDALDSDAPVYDLPSKEAKYYQKFQTLEPYRPVIDHPQETLHALLEQETIASKAWIYDQFDEKVQGNTLQGKGRGASIVQIDRKALSMTTDGNARYIYLDPEMGGKIVVSEAARNLVCSGAEPLAITDGLNYGNPNDPEVYWQMEKSIKGIREACLMLEIPVVSGNVSLYNQSEDGPIHPTPIIGMVGLIEDLDHITPNHFIEAGDLIYVIGDTEAEFGGSELQNLLEGTYFGKPPAIDLATEKDRQEKILRAIKRQVVQSVEDVSVGGLAVQLAKSTFPNKLGIEVFLEHEDPTTILFSETQSRYIVTVSKDQQDVFEAIIPEAKQVGTVTEDPSFTIHVNGKVMMNDDVHKLYEIWSNAIRKRF